MGDTFKLNYINTTMKKLISLVIAVCLSLSSIGCGWFDDSDTPSNKSAKAASPVKGDPSVSSRITVAKDKLDSTNKKLDQVHKDLDAFKDVVGEITPTPTEEKADKEKE